MQNHVFTASYAPDFNGKIEVDFRQLYGDYIKTLMPDGSSNIISQTSALITCEASFKDSQGNNIAYPQGYPWEWYVSNANLKSATDYMTWVGTHFLTNQPLEKRINKVSPEWLTYHDTAANGGMKLKAVFYPKSGGSETQLIKNDNVGGCFTVNVSYATTIQLADNLPGYYLGYYDIILTDKSDTLLARQRYILDVESGKEHYYCFVNALGGIDTLICDGENVLQPEITHNIGRFGGQFVPIDDTDEHRKWKQLTGFMPNKWRNWVYELLSAKQGAAKYDPETGTYQAIIVESSEIAMSDHGPLAEASFGYILDDSVNAISDEEYQEDRSLHQSKADAAAVPVDLTTTVELAFAATEKLYETEEVSLSATKLYVTWDENLAIGIEVVVMVGGTSAGSFVTGTDGQPFIVTKTAEQTVQFITESGDIADVSVTYYPVNQISI